MHVKAGYIETPLGVSLFPRQFGVREQDAAQQEESVGDDVCIEHQHVAPVVMHLSVANKKLHERFNFSVASKRFKKLFLIGKIRKKRGADTHPRHLCEIHLDTDHLHVVRVTVNDPAYAEKAQTVQTADRILESVGLE